VRYIYATPVTRSAGGPLHIYHTLHSHSRRCVKYMSHPSLARQAVCHIHSTAGGALHICHTRHSHGRWCVEYMSLP
jgi:hypothetical protein